MSDLWLPFFGQDDGDDVEAKGAVVDFVACEKVAGGAVHSGLLVKRDGRLGRAEIFAGPGLDLDEDERPIGVDHNPVDLTGFAVEIARKRFEALAFEILLAILFAPSAEQLLICQQLPPIRQQVSYIESHSFGCFKSTRRI